MGTYWMNALPPWIASFPVLQERSLRQINCQIVRRNGYIGLGARSIAFARDENRRPEHLRSSPSVTFSDGAFCGVGGLHFLDGWSLLRNQNHWIQIKVAPAEAKLIKLVHLTTSYSAVEESSRMKERSNDEKKWRKVRTLEKVVHRVKMLLWSFFEERFFKA